VIAWTCTEHEERQRGPYWFLVPGGVATALIMIGVVAGNYFFIGFVALSFGVLMVLMRRRPRRVSFALTEEGVFIDGAVHEYPRIQSFWIFRDAGGVSELSIETKKILTPFVRIPLTGADGSEVRAYLSRHIPEKEHKNFATDQIAKMLGF
jgi:hypothetical protein